MGSRPAIVRSTSATSFTVFANGPMWSSDEAKAISPYRDTRPYVGFKPTTPQNDAGWRIDPPVSEPSVTTAMSAATAAAEPPDDPPGTRFKSRGLRTGRNAEFSFDEPIANSSQFILPSTTAPAASMRATAVQSYGGMYLSRILEPAVVRTPRVDITSLMPTGTPPSGGSGLPSAAMRSMRSACSRARSFDR